MIDNEKMSRLQIETDPRVPAKFKSYPITPRKKLKELRKLIIEVANEISDIEKLEETLKWDEPSYIAKTDSTIRIAWKEKSPHQIAIYFKCTSKLIPTFKKVFGNKFSFEGDRAIIFDVKGSIPKQRLKKCIKTALQYHKIKNLPKLGLK